MQGERDCIFHNRCYCILFTANMCRPLQGPIYIMTRRKSENIKLTITVSESRDHIQGPPAAAAVPAPEAAGIPKAVSRQLLTTL